MPVSVINSLRPVPFRALRVGELVLDDFGEGAVLALVVSKGGSWVMYAEIEGPGIAPFSTRQVEGRDKCLSYGTDWVLEARPPRSMRIHAQGTRDFEAGTAYLVAGEVNLAFLHHQNGRSQPVLFDVRAGKFLYGDWPAACGFGWAIWVSEEDFGRPGAKPLFEHAPRSDRAGGLALSSRF